MEYRPGRFHRLAVPNSDAPTAETGDLDALAVAHAIGALPPDPGGFTFVLIAPEWGHIAHLLTYPFD
jgi:hypothetical protein